MHISSDPWTWIGVILTLCIFSFLYRDNKFYRFAEHLALGLANAWSVSFTFHRVLMPYLIKPVGSAFAQLTAQGPSWSLLSPSADATFLVLIPAFIGSLYFMRFVPSKAWLVRFPIGIFMGYYTGVSVPAQFDGGVFPQVKGTIITPALFEASIFQGLWAVLVLVGVLGTLTSFFFSRGQEGILKWGGKTRIVYIMVGFGASFGFTVMARISLAIGRFYFLLRDWLGVIS